MLYCWIILFPDISTINYVEVRGNIINKTQNVINKNTYDYIYIHNNLFILLYILYIDICLLYKLLICYYILRYFSFFFNNILFILMNSIFFYTFYSI